MLFIGRNEINLVRAQGRRRVNVGQQAMQNPAVNQDKGHVEPTAQNEADNDPVSQNVPEPQPGPANPRCLFVLQSTTPTFTRHSPYTLNIHMFAYN